MKNDPHHQKEVAELERNREAEGIARQIAISQAREAVKQFGLKMGGSFAEGIRAGFDMDQRIIDWMHDRVRFALRLGGVQSQYVQNRERIISYRPNTKAWVAASSHRTERAPDARAIETFKQVQRSVENVPGVPDFVSLTPRLMRCEIDTKPYRRRFTAVVITVSCLCWPDSILVINTEEGR